MTVRAALSGSFTIMIALMMLAGGPRANSAPAPGGTKWALVVGVENYENLNQLHYAAEDARRVANSLVKDAGFSRENVFVLTSDATGELNQATSVSIVRRLVSMKLNRI